jgi:hypothetical protein
MNTQRPYRFSLLKRASVVAVLMTGLITAATAQNAPRAPQTPAKPPVNLRPGNGSSAATPDGGINSDYVFQGWNYVLATNCELYDSGGYTYLVLYPQQGGYFYTTSPQYQNMFMTACQTGNWIGLYVYDNYGDWSTLYTYDYNQ